MVEVGILDSKLDTVIYADEKIEITRSKIDTTIDGKREGGYSHKEKKEIGINLKSGNKVTTVGNLENTYWHEVTHQRDKRNTKEESREKYATNMGNSAETIGSVNNFLYGKGGLSNKTIINYYLKNQDTLQLNNEYVNNLDLNLLENKAYMVSRNLNNIVFEKLNTNHQFVIITGGERYLKNYMKEYNIENNLTLEVEAIEIKENMVSNGIEKNEKDTHFISLGGYNGSKNGRYREEQKGILIKDINSPDDIKFLEIGKFENFEIGFNNNKGQEYNERKIIEVYSYQGKIDELQKESRESEISLLFLFSRL